jgi:hypothetical protein
MSISSKRTTDGLKTLSPKPSMASKQTFAGTLLVRITACVHRSEDCYLKPIYGFSALHSASQSVSVNFIHSLSRIHR